MFATCSQVRFSTTHVRAEAMGWGDLRPRELDGVLPWPGRRKRE